MIDENNDQSTHRQVPDRKDVEVYTGQVSSSVSLVLLTWLDYKSYGTNINNTNILPFKVPLKESVAKNLQPEQQFTTAILIKSFPNLKYVIDLTNTSRYYDQQDFTKAGIKYQKVMIPGMQVPPLEFVKRSFAAVLRDITMQNIALRKIAMLDGKTRDTNQIDKSPIDGERGLAKSRKRQKNSQS
uniref:Uncharacterized protein n=1 Tax=Trichogramma kaykai TaxID=54128 RepID=A0ABD2VUQ6_9HYME